MSTRASDTETTKHFGRLADTYDDRWQGYNQRTVPRALEALQVSATARVLDVGCGTGRFEQLAEQQFPEATFVGVDVTPAMVAAARGKFRHTSRVTFSLAHAEALPFDAASFDAVVSCNMLHHVRGVGAFMRECARVLRARGQLVIVDWSRDFVHGRLAHYWLRLTKRSYVRMYRVRELIELLTPLGLTVEHVHQFFVPPYYGMLRLVARKTGVRGGG